MDTSNTPSETGVALVTGGAGYFGELLCKRLLARGYTVRIIDLNPTELEGIDTAFEGDILDEALMAKACDGVDIVFHNVAQVPLAKDKKKFWSVNRDGTRSVLEAARTAGVKKVVYTSSSAVFGAPETNPVTRETLPNPAEDYGEAKLAGEQLCHDYVAKGLDVSIVRPRTIIGHGRLGIFQVLFDWIAAGKDVPVFNGGHNIYQFVHADDLADACIAAGERAGAATYNIGAKEFGSMRELLEGLIAHAGSNSRVKSLPMGLTRFGMEAMAALGLSPLGPYHALMYGQSMYFDISDAAAELGYSPVYSNHSAICSSYDWYLEHRGDVGGAPKSHHKSPLKKGALAMVPPILSVMPS